jgi:hypothetical protein
VARDVIIGLVFCFSMCSVTKHEHHSTHLHFIYNHCPSWGLFMNGD